MKKKINMSLVIIAVLAIAATVIGITIIYYNLFQKQVRADLRVSAKLLKDTHYFTSENVDSDRIDLSADMSELRVTWVDKDGTVLYDNDAKAEKLENHMNRPEVQLAFEKKEGESIRRSDTMNKNTFYYALLLENDTVLRVAVNAESMWSVFASVTPLITLILLCIIVVCVAISHFLTRQFIKPIETMASRLEDSDYETPYKELEPFVHTIRAQHTQILSAAKARQDFTANVSHELKTPLTAISGYAELLETNMVEGEQKKHFYQEIQKNAKRLLALITDIIRLSEIDQSEKGAFFEDVDLYEIIEECMESLKVNASQRNLMLTFEGVPCRIWGNKDMLRELTENLVQNAIRYNTPGGKVQVFLTNEERPVLIVKDNGIGIPAAEQERIFERFYRVDKSRSKETGGTGLGLAIVKHIVELHDAKIIVDSAPGVGTTMEVLF